ncbi:hypothetical protein [Paenibacillus naphthalenovorans]|uniref:hypothetical protein n=1 Tax=Paenibacillus naphthalenovorans TaxID=162209 RepID=UPI003D2D6246
MTNYRDKFTQITAQLAAALRSKADTIPFLYGDQSFDLRNRQARIDVIGRIAADYIAAHAEFNQRALDRWNEGGAKGERPSPVSVDTALLGRLADAVLNEELTDTDAHKVAHSEYPFLSETQMARRQEGRRGSDRTNMSGESAFETYDGAAKHHSGMSAQLATDGRSYRMPIRRTRGKYELAYIDQNAKGRNKERREQYVKDTAPGPLVTYNLRDTGGELADEFVQCRGTGDTWRDSLSL